MDNQKQHFHSVSHQRENNSLLIQFILHELSQTTACMAKYLSLINLIQLAPSCKSRELLEEACSCMTQIAGDSHHSMRIFSWNLTEGTMTKLKLYTCYFSGNLDSQESNAIQLERHTEKAWINSLECLDLLREQLALPIIESTDLSNLKKISNKLNIRIQKIAQSLTRILPQFRDDESVLYYLLKHQERLSDIWGPFYLTKLFKKLFPKGKEEVECFLISRYNKRHFSHIGPDLTKKIYQLLAHV